MIQAKLLNKGYIRYTKSQQFTNESHFKQINKRSESEKIFVRKRILYPIAIADGIVVVALLKTILG